MAQEDAWKVIYGQYGEERGKELHQAAYDYKSTPGTYYYLLGYYDVMCDEHDDTGLFLSLLGNGNGLEVEMYKKGREDALGDLELGKEKPDIVKIRR
jgi:hypothetical protein